MQAGTYFPKVRRMLLCSCSFNFTTLLASFHAASRAPCSCSTLSPPETILKFWSIGVTLMRFTWANHSSDGFWSRMSAWRTIAFVNFTRRIGFRMSELFRKIDEDFGGSISWKTQPNCRVFDELWFRDLTRDGCSRSTVLPCSIVQHLWLLQHSHCTFVTILFKPSAGLLNLGWSSNLAVCIGALFSKSATTL